MDNAKREEKIKKILAQLDINEDHPEFAKELANALAAKEFGLTWARIEVMIQERLEGVL